MAPIFPSTHPNAVFLAECSGHAAPTCALVRGTFPVFPMGPAVRCLSIVTRFSIYCGALCCSSVRNSTRAACPMAYQRSLVTPWLLVTIFVLLSCSGSPQLISLELNATSDVGVVAAQPKIDSSVLLLSSSAHEVARDADAVPTETPAIETPAPETETPAPETVPPPDTPEPSVSSAPKLTNDMRSILRRVGSLPCSNSVRSRMFALLYEKNEALYTTCVTDSGYKFFPYPGKPPTTRQIIGIVTSTPCMQLFSGAILANFPECDIDFVSIRSGAEVYMRIKQDFVDKKKAAPTEEQFYELYNLNRVVNLLNENETLIEEAFAESPTPAAVSLSEMTRLMNPIILTPGVTLDDDMTIHVEEMDEEKPKKRSKTSEEIVGELETEGSSRMVTLETMAPTDTPTPSAMARTPLASGVATQSMSSPSLYCLVLLLLAMGLSML